MDYPKRTEELTVITKTYDLILWSCQHTGKFRHFSLDATAHAAFLYEC
jgi:hypothetical protein